MVVLWAVPIDGVLEAPTDRFMEPCVPGNITRASCIEREADIFPTIILKFPSCDEWEPFLKRNWSVLRSPMGHKRADDKTFESVLTHKFP